MSTDSPAEKLADVVSTDSRAGRETVTCINLSFICSAKPNMVTKSAEAEGSAAGVLSEIDTGGELNKDDVG